MEGSDARCGKKDEAPAVALDEGQPAGAKPGFADAI